MRLFLAESGALNAIFSLLIMAAVSLSAVSVFLSFINAVLA